MNPENTNKIPKRRTLPEAAKPYRWKKGCPSPNPGGRPKTAHISQALRAALAAGKADEFAEILCAVASGRKKGNAVQLAAIREIADRTEGKPHQSVEVDSRLRVNIAERLAEARKRRMERGHLLATRFRLRWPSHHRPRPPPTLSDCPGRCLGQRPFVGFHGSFNSS